MPEPDLPLHIYDELMAEMKRKNPDFELDSPGRHRLELRDVPSSLVPTPYPRRTFEREDDSVYHRVPAAFIESGDDIDSTTIVDDGAPD